MTSENYRQLLNNEFKAKEMTKEDFDNTLMHFAMLYHKEQLKLYGVVKSLPIQDLPNCTRVEVIDQKGRSYVNWKPTNKVRLSMQDDGRTAKIFID